MTTHTKTIRTWAIGEGLDCPTRGKIPAHIVDAFHDAHDTNPPPPPVDAEDDAPVDDDTLGISVSLPPSAAAHLETVAQAFADALGAAFEAGRDSMRADLLTQLQPDD